MAAIRTYVNRALDTPISIDERKKEINTIKIIARNNGYNEGLIDDIIKNRNRKKKDKPETLTGYNKISYIGPITQKIARLLHKFGLQTTMKSVNTIKQAILNNKDKIDTLDKSGVYTIDCEDCNAKYIGQTGRKLKTRIAEHKNKNKFSAVSQHLLNTGHTISERNIHMLHKCTTQKRVERWTCWRVLK